MEEIRELYRCLEKGYNSYPLHVPGTSYWKAMKVCKMYFLLSCFVFLALFLHSLYIYYYYVTEDLNNYCKSLDSTNNFDTNGLREIFPYESL